MAKHFTQFDVGRKVSGEYSDIGRAGLLKLQVMLVHDLGGGLAFLPLGQEEDFLHNTRLQDDARAEGLMIRLEHFPKAQPAGTFEELAEDAIAFLEEHTEAGLKWVWVGRDLFLADEEAVMSLRRREQ